MHMKKAMVESASYPVAPLKIPALHLNNMVSERQIEINLVRRLLHAALREALLPFYFEQGALHIPFTHSHKVIVIKEFTYSKIRAFILKGEIFLLNHGQTTPLNRLEDLITLLYDELKHKIDEEAWNRFLTEVYNSLRNYQLVSNYQQLSNQNLKAILSQLGYKTLIEYVDNHFSPQEQMLFFETWTVKAHPYHPCHKAKLGFDLTDFIHYSSELNRDISLPVAAVKRELFHLESETPAFDYPAWFSKNYPVEWQGYQAALESLALDPEYFYPIFVHPWQLNHVLKNMFADEIDQKDIIFLHHVTITTKASLSFRTLIAVENITRPHIKLPVAVQSTSALRTISAAAIENGPKFSKILRSILSIENNFDGHLEVAQESCGLHIKHPDLSVQKNFGIIYRDNPAQFIQSKQMPIVAASLFEDSPITEVPLFIELIHTAVGRTLSAATQYFSRYCEVILRGYLDLFLLYGIVLEGHQQNTIVVFEDFLPRSIIARDWGGIRVHLPTLKQAGFCYDAHPDSATVTHDLTEAFHKFNHSVTIMQLGELVLILSDYYQIDEAVFWKIIKENIAKRFQALKSQLNDTINQSIPKAFFEEDWQIKSLMQMRLSNLYNKYIYASVKNPLAEL